MDALVITVIRIFYVYLTVHVLVVFWSSAGWNNAIKQDYPTRRLIIFLKKNRQLLRQKLTAAEDQAPLMIVLNISIVS